MYGMTKKDVIFYKKKYPETFHPDCVSPMVSSCQSDWDREPQSTDQTKAAVYGGKDGGNVKKNDK